MFVLLAEKWRSGSDHQGSATYDDVGLTGFRENVSSHAQEADYASILSELSNCATYEISCNVSSPRNNISPQVYKYDYVRNLEAENVAHVLPDSKCPKNKVMCGVATRNNILSQAYDDVGNLNSEDGCYVLPNSA
jgi:hypothetical protein